MIKKLLFFYPYRRCPDGHLDRTVISTVPLVDVGKAENGFPVHENGVQVYCNKKGTLAFCQRAFLENPFKDNRRKIL